MCDCKNSDEPCDFDNCFCLSKKNKITCSGCNCFCCDVKRAIEGGDGDGDAANYLIATNYVRLGRSSCLRGKAKSFENANYLIPSISRRLLQSYLLFSSYYIKIKNELAKDSFSIQKNTNGRR